MKKILFISHEASRTGAPLILLHLIKWLKSNTNNIQFDILLIDKGPIEVEFSNECTNTFIYSEIHKPLKLAEIITKKIASKFGVKSRKEEVFFQNIAANNYDLIYANSIVSIPFASKIKKIQNKLKVLVHVHELDTIIKMALPDFNHYKQYVDKYIAVSKLVKENLIENYKIDKDKIDIVHGFGVVQDDSIKKNNNIFTVGASGTAHWRKGDDLFIQVANYINTNFPEENIEFLWVGNDSHNKIVIESDILKLGLKNKVNFVGEQTDPIQFYRNFDVFLLTSREDPFPLVCIEMASLGIPLICFEKASGTTEIVSKGGGFVVPYIDIQAMAEKIMLYYYDANKRIDDGEKAKQLFKEFTIDKIAPLLYQSITSQLN